MPKRKNDGPATPVYTETNGAPADLFDEIGVGRQAAEADGDIGVYRVNGDGRMGVVMVPRAYRKLTEEGRELVSDIQHVAAHIGELQQQLEDAVAAARAAGVSWDLIGWSVGTTGRAAGMRWSERDGR